MQEIKDLFSLLDQGTSTVSLKQSRKLTKAMHTALLTHRDNKQKIRYNVWDSPEKLNLEMGATAPYPSTRLISHTHARICAHSQMHTLTPHSCTHDPPAPARARARARARRRGGRTGYRGRRTRRRRQGGTRQRPRPTPSQLARLSCAAASLTPRTWTRCTPLV